RPDAVGRARDPPRTPRRAARRATAQLPHGRRFHRPHGRRLPEAALRLARQRLWVDLLRHCRAARRPRRDRAAHEPRRAAQGMAGTLLRRAPSHRRGLRPLLALRRRRVAVRVPGIHPLPAHPMMKAHVREGGLAFWYAVLGGIAAWTVHLFRLTSIDRLAGTL